MDGTPIPDSYGHGLSFLESLLAGAGPLWKVLHRCQAPLEKLDPRFSRGSRKPSPPLRRRPPTPQQGT